MDCDRIPNLIDPYMDGELSASMASEVSAHCLHCHECGRLLALAQVTASVISSDQGGPSLSDGFTDRLLACVHHEPVTTQHRWRRMTFYVGPIAAAAVLAWLFVVPHLTRDPIKPVVAGKKETWPLDGSPNQRDAQFTIIDGNNILTDANDVEAWNQLSEPFSQGLGSTMDAGRSLKQSFDSALLDVLATLEAQEAAQSKNKPNQQDKQKTALRDTDTSPQNKQEPELEEM